MSARRVRARVEGTVQGVGFRPFVYQLATELGLAGFVLNDERGVVVEIEGEPGRVDEFLARLPAEAPPLADVERVQVTDAEPAGECGFAIAASERGDAAAALVSPDMATCDDCLAELFDPGDRRHRYPFINCTNCGPRFTIIRDVPYDRPATTMADFEMCAACRAEYEDPLDRRFHAQPNACPNCGPAARLVDSAGAPVVSEHADASAAAAAAIAEGRIVAVKGIGGYHLACRADDAGTVAALRSRKHREDKPFALMAADLAAARALVDLSPAEERLLSGRERPIVIARRRRDAPVAAAVAPGKPDLGVMLAYSPLHHLLHADCGATLVMTSANLSDEPIAYRDADALGRLGEIADLFLVHDRPIHVRTDDSVLRALDPALRAEPLLVRRSRGYVPRSVDLPLEAPPLLACGAELKSTFCLAKGTRAWVGHHIGDLRNLETLTSFRDGVEHFERLFAVEPEIVAHDLHPDYLSTRYGLEREGVEHVGVQHHHAHLAAVLAEHGEQGPALGAIFDGTGYGPDGTVWGGELLAGGLDGYERFGHLRQVRMPGGDRAVAEPWRMACSWLAEASGDDVPPIPRSLAAIDPGLWRQVAELVRSGVSAPVTSSIGRLFDAVAALCAIRTEVNYEGQAAIELEAAARPGEHGAYPLPLAAGPGAGDTIVLDARATVNAVRDDVEAGTDPGTIAARFHNGVAAATAEALTARARESGTGAAVLSGGVFGNRLLLETTAAALADAGLRVLIPLRLPPNDGAIAYGQAAVAAALAVRRAGET